MNPIAKKNDPIPFSQSRTAASGSFAANRRRTWNWIGRAVLAGLILLAVLLPGNANAQTPSFQWAKRVASTTTDLEFPLGMALDSQGNSYVTSWFDGTNDFGGVTLTNTTGGGQDIFVAKYDAAGVLQWAKRAGGNTPEWDAGCGIGVDNAGNVYVTGAFVGTADFDGLTLTGSTRNEFFLAKYDRAGTVQWVRESTGGSSVYGTALAVDSEGNSYATGYADNSLSVTFGTTELASASLSGYSAFLVKYDNTGTVRWAQLMGGPGHTYAVKVAVDAAGNVYVRGSFSENMTIGTSNLVSTGPDDAFIAKFNSAGTLVWARQAGGEGGDAGADGGVVVDSAGNVYISGAFDSTINFGGGISLANVGAVREGFEAFDAFVAKYNSAGVPQWARRAGGTRLDIYWDVALDGQGNVYAAGALSSDAVAPSGSGGAMIAKYDPAGTLQWAHSASGPPASPISSVVAKVAVDPAGHAFLAGLYSTPTTFGTTVLQPQGYWNFFLTKITSGEPVITLQPQSQTVNAGQNVSFSVTATGTAPLTYQWRWEGADLEGATSAVYSLPAVRMDQAGAYTVRVSNSAGSVTSAPPALLTVNPAMSGTVVAWGSNDRGETNVPTGLNGVTAVVGGNDHSLALKSDGTVVAWGSNDFGQSTIPADMSGVTAIAAGFYHCVVLKSDGTVVAWGHNEFGQSTVPSGLNGIIAISAGFLHTLALKRDGTVVAWGAGKANTGTFPEFGQSTIPPGLSGVTAISAGALYSLALKRDGTVVAWGRNEAGQITAPPGLSGVAAIASGGSHNMVLRYDGSIVAWGYNYAAQSEIPPGLSEAVAVAAGENHSIVLKSDGSVAAWGYSSYGQTKVPAGLRGVIAIAAGSDHTLALVGSASSNAPTIAAQSTGNGVVLSWPATTTTYHVESTSSLSAPIVWNEVIASPQTDANSISILLPNAGLQTFFRLVKR